MERNKLRFWKQGITVTGVGSLSFDECLKGLSALTSVMGRYAGVVGSAIAGPQTLVGANSAITAETRYLTPRTDMAGADVVAIPSNVDPQAILEDLRGDDYEFTTDNNILFSEEVHREGEEQYVSCLDSNLMVVNS